MKKILVRGLAGVIAGAAVTGSLLMGSTAASAATQQETPIQASIAENYTVSKHVARGTSVALSLQSHKGNVEALVEGCYDGNDLGQVKRFREGVAQTQTLVQHIEPGTCFKLVLTSDKNTTVEGALRS